MKKPGKTEYIQKYEGIKASLKNALNTKAWDGSWYKRAFTDEGKALGCINNEECKIDSIAQSWAVISNAGEEEKIYQAMESLDKNLKDKNARNNKIIRPTI